MSFFRGVHSKLSSQDSRSSELLRMNYIILNHFHNELYQESLYIDGIP